MNTKKNLLAAIIFIASTTLGSLWYAAWTDNFLPIQNIASPVSCADTVKMYLNEDNDSDGKSDYYLYLNSNFILNGNINNYTAGQILWNSGTTLYTKVKYYTPQTSMLYKIDSSNVIWSLDNSTFWRASRVFPYNTPLRGIATTPNKVIFERPSDNDANKNIVSVVYDYQYKYAIGFDGVSISSYRYNQVPTMAYMDNVWVTYITTLPWSAGNAKRSRSSIQYLSTCRNYELHRCGNGILETWSAWYTNQFTWETCDGTAWVPVGYTCTSSCTLQANPSTPTCSLTTTTPTITSGQTATLNWSYTNAVVASFVPAIGGITFLYPNRSNSSISVSPTTTTTYTLIVTWAAGTTPVSCPVTITVNQPMYALTLDKTLINNILYRSGDLVAFRVDFANVGSATVHNALLTDHLPKGLTYVSSQLYGVNPPYNFTTGIFQGNEFVKYTGFTLTPGQQWYMIITGSFRWYQRAKDTWNRAFLDSDETNEILDSALFYVYKPTGNATVTKTADKTSYYPGEDIKFTIGVTNNGPDTIDTIQLIDIWPAGTCITLDGNFTSTIPTPPMTSSINPYTWNFNTAMTINQTAYLYLTGHIKNDPSCAGVYTNIVDLKYMVNGESKTGQAQTTINVLAVPASTMTIEKKIVQYGNNVGDPIVFELVYKNNWTATITSYDIVDYWPGTLNFVSASPMPTTQTIISWGALLRWIFTTPLAPNGWGKITLNWTIK